MTIPPNDDPTRPIPLSAPSPPPGSDDPVPYLLVLSGGAAGTVVRLNTTVTIGRDVDVGLQLTDADVSRTHARVVVRDGIGVLLADLRSAAGTFRNGHRIDAPERLEDGDTIAIGAATLLKFTYDASFERDARDNLFRCSGRDPLTGAWGRLSFNDHLRRELAFARRHIQPLALLLISADDLVKGSAAWAPAAADALLLELARRLNSTLRAEDVFARFDANVFAALCRHTDRPAVLALASRLRSLAVEPPFTTAILSVPITPAVSIGVGVFPHLPVLDDNGLLNVADLLRAAELALSEASRTGRIVVASHSTVLGSGSR